MKEVRGNHFNFKYDVWDEAVSKTIIKTAENTYDQVTKEYGIREDDISPLIAEGIAVYLAQQVYPQCLDKSERPDALKLVDEDYFFENDGYNYSGVYMGYFVRKYGMEAFKEVYAEKKPLEAYIYDGFEEDAIDSF